ncbi:hypothetical protein G7Y79_00061g093030 [Physcia stellaris]|nr:hypothetical protein G7Y79_00061g093030 [Physcia stellaris]
MDQLLRLKDDITARFNGYHPLSPRRPISRSLVWRLALTVIFVFLLSTVFSIHTTYLGRSSSGAVTSSDLIAHDTLDYLINFPMTGTEFGQMGQRVQLINHRLGYLESESKGMTAKQSQALAERLDDAVIASFPFLRNPTEPNQNMRFQALRDSFIKGSRGIVMSLNKKDFRYACHLISGVRTVLHSTLPIQIAYAGDEDLPVQYREKLISLGKDIETVDLLTMVDDKTLDLAHGTFGTKPLAMLLSRFEQVILVDADAVFLQPPEALFDSDGYKKSGTYLFHDRRLNKGGFKERHDWWQSHLKYNPPSATLLGLASYSQGYSAEQDSGVVVFDKSRTPVLLGLLHICWQNAAAGREYMNGKVFGDKESYWFGLELCQVPFYFEKHYGNGLGPRDDEGKICGNAIAHADEKDRLLWFNGALLKNKYQDNKEYGNFTHYMLDGHWLPQNGGNGISCQDQGEIFMVNQREKDVLSGSIQEAKLVDEKFKDLIST